MYIYVPINHSKHEMTMQNDTRDTPEHKRTNRGENSTCQMHRADAISSQMNRLWMSCRRSLFRETFRFLLQHIIITMANQPQRCHNNSLADLVFNRFSFLRMFNEAIRWYVHVRCHWIRLDVSLRNDKLIVWAKSLAIINLRSLYTLSAISATTLQHPSFSVTPIIYYLARNIFFIFILSLHYYNFHCIEWILFSCIHHDMISLTKIEFLVEDTTRHTHTQTIHNADEDYNMNEWKSQRHYSSDFIFCVSVCGCVSVWLWWFHCLPFQYRTMHTKITSFQYNASVNDSVSVSFRIVCHSEWCDAVHSVIVTGSV